MHLHDDPPSPQEPPLHHIPLPPPRARALKPSATPCHSSTPLQSPPNAINCETDSSPNAPVTGNSTTDLTSLPPSVIVVEDVDNPSESPITKDVNALTPSRSTSLTALALRGSLNESRLGKGRSTPRTPNNTPSLTLTLNTLRSMLQPGNPFPTVDESSRMEVDGLSDMPISPAISAVLQRFDVTETGTLTLDSDRLSLISSVLDIYLHLYDSEQDDGVSSKSPCQALPSTEESEVEDPSPLDPPGQGSTENEVPSPPRPTSDIGPRRNRPQNLNLHLESQSLDTDSASVPKSAPARSLRPLPPAPSARNIRPLPQPPTPHANPSPAVNPRASTTSTSSNSSSRRSPLPTPPITTRSSTSHSCSDSLASISTTSSSFTDSPVTTPSDSLPEHSRRPAPPTLQIPTPHPTELLTPLPSDIPIPPSPKTAKRHQASKLRRFLGEDVPPELLYGSRKDLLVGDMKRLRARLRASVERPQAMYIEDELLYSDELESSINRESDILEEEDDEDDDDDDCVFFADAREEGRDSDDSDSDRDLDDFEEAHIDYARTNVINYQKASQLKRTSRIWVLEKNGPRQERNRATDIQPLRRS